MPFLISLHDPHHALDFINRYFIDLLILWYSLVFYFLQVFSTITMSPFDLGLIFRNEFNIFALKLTKTAATPKFVPKLMLKVALSKVALKLLSLVISF